jgi:hypothetical protein
MSYLDQITEFLFNENRRLSSKAAVVLFIIIGIFFIDNMLGFTFYYNSDKKIEEINKLNYIIKDSTVDQYTKSYAIALRSTIIDRKNVLIKTLSFFQDILPKSSVKVQSDKIVNTEYRIVTISRNNFWFHLTSGGVFYIFALLMIPGILFTDKKTSFSQKIATIILASILLWGIGLFFYWIFNFIPLISKSTLLWNYLLNVVLQFTIIYGLKYLILRKK